MNPPTSQRQYDHETRERRDRAIATARREGLEVHYAGPQVLHLDLDTTAQHDQAMRQLEEFGARLEVRRAVETVSPGANRHLYVYLRRPMGRRDRLFWQAVLGTDPLKAALDWLWERSLPPELQAEERFEDEPFMFDRPRTEKKVVWENPSLACFQPEEEVASKLLAAAEILEEQGFIGYADACGAASGMIKSQGGRPA